jgi:hypothetical protein
VPLVELEGHPMPWWVAREIKRARRNGWRGVVLSGYRTDREQLAAAARYAASLGQTIEQVYPHGPLASNHCGRSWPAGAVDVTQPADLAEALHERPLPWHGRRLTWAVDVGFNDRAHFSRDGH